MVLIKVDMNGGGGGSGGGTKPTTNNAGSVVSSARKARRVTVFPASSLPVTVANVRPPVVIYDEVHEAFEPASGKWFCYLVKQLGGFSKNEANIKMAANPYHDMGNHHGGGGGGGGGDTNDKTAKLGKGFWQIEMIVGPLDSEEESDRTRQNWLSTSRGLPSRRERGLSIAIELCDQTPGRQVFCFDKRLVPIPLQPYLRRVNMEYLSVDDDAYWKLITAVAMRETSQKRRRFR